MAFVIKGDKASINNWPTLETIEKYIKEDYTEIKWTISKFYTEKRTDEKSLEQFKKILKGSVISVYFSFKGEIQQYPKRFWNHILSLSLEKFTIEYKNPFKNPHKLFIRTKTSTSLKLVNFTSLKLNFKDIQLIAKFLKVSNVENFRLEKVRLEPNKPCFQIFQSMRTVTWAGLELQPIFPIEIEGLIQAVKQPNSKLRTIGIGVGKQPMEIDSFATASLSYLVLCKRYFSMYEKFLPLAKEIICKRLLRSTEPFEKKYKNYLVRQLGIKLKDHKFP